MYKRQPFNRAYFEWDSREYRVRPVLRRLAQYRRECDAFKDGSFELLAAQGGLLHYRRRGRTQTAEIALNRTPRLLTVQMFGQPAEIEPFGFAVLTQNNA